MKTKNYNQYEVYFLLRNDVVTGGERFKTELPVYITIFALDEHEAERQARQSLPPRLRDRILPGSVNVLKKLDGKTNRQLIALQK